VESMVYKVPQAAGPLHFTVDIPGSKSITNRALLIAALCASPVRLSNLLFSDDSRHFMEALVQLGFETKIDEAARTVEIVGAGGAIPNQTARIDVGSAGTAARFLTAMLAAAGGEYHVDASPQMRARPMKPLLDALRQQGATFSFSGNPDCLPFQIKSDGLRGGRVSLDASASSQFLSALLLLGCLAQQDMEIVMTGGLPAKPFVEMTLRMMEDFGVAAENHDYRRFLVPAGQLYFGREYTIEPDISNACYFMAMALLTGGTAVINGIQPDSLQGDLGFVDILAQMGAAIEWLDTGIQVAGPKSGRFSGVDVDLGAMPDQVITLAALAPFASGATRIRNIDFIRYHESDRIAAIITELQRVGIGAEETEDGLIIHPGIPQAAEIETYDDHRMAMGFALMGLRVPGIIIKNPDCTAKTFENYFEVFQKVVEGDRR
jgi:3-phosphoshikimate 1-carboxyvinyltransferase